MRDRLIELLEATGMVENRARCIIIADELIAKGVVLPTPKEEGRR